MKKNFGAKAWLYPMPVLIIGSYDAEGKPDAMNAAWGGISLEDRISICVDDAHKTTANVLARKAFTVHVATAAQMVACDYVGVVSGNDNPDKLARTGWHVKKSDFIDAPVFEDLPMVLECELVSYDKSDCRMVGKIVNVAVDESCLTSDGKVDVAKLDPITFDPVNHVYLKLGEKAGEDVAGASRTHQERGRQSASRLCSRANPPRGWLHTSASCTASWHQPTNIRGM